MNLLTMMVEAATGWSSLSLTLDRQAERLTALANYVRNMEELLFRVGVVNYEWKPSGDHRSENGIGWVGVVIWLGCADCTREELADALDNAGLAYGWGGNLSDFEEAHSEWGYIGVRDAPHPRSPEGLELSYPG